MTFSEKDLNSLATRHYVVGFTKEADKTKSAYYNAFLLSNFGIILDKPEYASHDIVDAISQVLKLEVPASFYNNPQDIKYYTCEELLIEQLVSYFLVETGTGIYDHVEIFEKDLPQYKVGDEIKLREFKVLNTDKEVEKVLEDIVDAYCAYTRPLSLDEMSEFIRLVTTGYYTPSVPIACKDNIIELALTFENDPESYGNNEFLLRMLDQKDLVKLSIQYYGEDKDFVTKELYKAGQPISNLIKKALPLVKKCPLSKKQAKFYNKLIKVFGSDYKLKKESNVNSPYRLAKIAMDNGNVLEAANIFAKNGSLLERNLNYLLSRANPKEAVEILDLLPAKNPMVLYQLVSGIINQTDEGRTFTFYSNRKVKTHIETEYESQWRKSRLNESTKKLVHDICVDKIDKYYKSLPSLGKVYIADNFYKIGVPTNTSASGRGLDVLPTGSRLPITSNYLRTFVYWKGVYDIDASLLVLRSLDKLDNENVKLINFTNYSYICRNTFDNNITFSGDCRSNNGAEYFDIDLEKVKDLGYKYLVLGFHGYDDRLDRGEIQAGIQYKKDLNTKVWDPKNIEFQFRVQGDSRGCLAYGVDLENKELIMLNLITNNECSVASNSEFNTVKKYFNECSLEINVGRIMSDRGIIVPTPEEADVIFDDNYKPTEEQAVVHSYELEKLVAYINEK